MLLASYRGPWLGRWALLLIAPLLSCVQIPPCHGGESYGAEIVVEPQKRAATATAAGISHATQPVDEVISLRCRDNNGPWLDCQMHLHDVGRRWDLTMGGRRFEFVHDGKGIVSMRRWPAEAKGHRPGVAVPPPWSPVTVFWGEDQALCWDGLCAKGEIPLD